MGPQGSILCDQVKERHLPFHLPSFAPNPDFLFALPVLSLWQRNGLDQPRSLGPIFSDAAPTQQAIENEQALEKRRDRSTLTAAGCSCALVNSPIEPTWGREVLLVVKTDEQNYMQK